MTEVEEGESKETARDNEEGRGGGRERGGGAKTREVRTDEEEE